MRTKEQVKREILAAIDRRAEQIVSLGEQIRRNPELGFKENAISLLGEEHFASAGHRAGSTDMGDLSHVMPVVHPYMGGAAGGHHGADFEIRDPVLAYVMPAKALALTAVDLLWDGGALAREVLRSSKPRMSKEEYLKFQRAVHRREAFDGGAPSPLSSPPVGERAG